MNESKKKDSMFTRGERQLLALIKTLNRVGLVTENELHGMAMEYLGLSLSMIENPITMAEVHKMLTSPGKKKSLQDIGLSAEDELWFMTLSAIANPDEVIRLMGHSSVDELRAKVEAMKRKKQS